MKEKRVTKEIQKKEKRIEMRRDDDKQATEIRSLLNNYKDIHSERGNSINFFLINLQQFNRILL